MKSSYLVFLLCLLSLLLRFFIASNESFLHIWDEQFHALVAKNMSEHPFTPMLFPSIDGITNTTNWNYSHIWLHKQPFFLWLMALSIKLFGSTAFAVRIPSILLSSFAIFGGYRLGKNLSGNFTGLTLAVLLSTSFIANNLSTGQETTDHNDAIFVSLVLISFWLLSEYWFNDKKKMMYCIGIIAGMAVLTKWLTGLIVFLPWFLLIVQKGITAQRVKHIITAFIITLLIVLPWQLYCYYQFPTEYAHEIQLNQLHFSSVVEGHDGDSWYYLKNLRHQYLKIQFPAVFIVWLGLLLFFLIKEKDNSRRIFVSIPILAVFLFFSIAQTKMPLFTFMVFFLLYYLLAFFISELRKSIQQRFSPVITRIILVLVLLFVSFHNLRLQEFRNIHFPKTSGEHQYYFNQNKQQYDQIMEIEQLAFSEKSSIFFNTPKHLHPSYTFFTGVPSFDFIPDEPVIYNLITEGYQPIFLFEQEAFNKEEMSQQYTILHKLSNGSLLTTPVIRE